MKRKHWYIILLLLGSLDAQAQDTLYTRISAEELLSKVINNNQALKLSKSNIGVAQQQTEITKQQQLPNISSSLNAFYLGDAWIWSKDFSHTTNVPMPHFGNTFSLQASQLIYKGGLVNNAIKASSLKEQVAQLDYAKDEQSIKLLVLGNYLDLYKLYNQKTVYLQNMQLVEARVKNIRQFYQQEMVTRNEVIRGDLMIANLKQAQLIIDNNISILSYQLAVAAGLPDNTILIPDSASVVQALQQQPKEYYMALANQENPVIKSAKLNTELAQTGLDIAKAERKPALAAFGGYSSQRPITTTTPAIDAYANGWQTGLSLTWNIESLFKAPKKIQLSKMQLSQAKEAVTLQQQNVNIEVNAAYIKYLEAISNARVFEETQRLANENYRITELKYLNQLAVVADITDATNAKIDADLQYVNAQINIYFNYYKLLKATGTL